MRLPTVSFFKRLKGLARWTLTLLIFWAFKNQLDAVQDLPALVPSKVPALFLARDRAEPRPCVPVAEPRRGELEVAAVAVHHGSSPLLSTSALPTSRRGRF